MQKLAADVHLCSVDKYGESTAVHKKVLIVDDSPAEVKLMQGLLEKEGYWPIGLHDPRRVEETITNERPSVILLDVVMPDRNGFQVCRDLKGNAEFNMIPVILVTSKDSASDKYWGQQQGADGYVTKPFTRAPIPAICSKLLGRSKSVPRSRSTAYSAAGASDSACRFWTSRKCWNGRC